MRRPPAAVLDFLPPFFLDLAFHVDFFTLQHLLDDRLRARGVKPSFELALFLAAQTVVYIVACPLIGSISDARGRTASAAAGAVVFAVVPLAFLLEVPDALFFAAMAVLGVGGALFWPAIQARLGERSGREGLGRAMKRFNLGWTIGKALGFELAGQLYARPWIGLTIGSAAGVATALLVLADRGPRSSEVSDAGAARAANIPSPKVATKRAFLVAGLVTLVAAWGAQKTLFALIPELRGPIDLDPRRQGHVLALLVVSQSGAFFALEDQSRWAYRAASLVLLAPLAALGSIGVYYATGFASLLAAAAVIGVTSGCAYTTSFFYSTDYDERRGLRMGINEAALGVGGALPLVGGKIATTTGDVRVPYLATAAIGALAAAFAIALLARRSIRPTGATER